MININIKSTNFDMTPDIEAYIKNKMTSVEKFMHPTENEEILMEVEMDRSTHHKKGDVHRAEVNVTWKGRLYRAEQSEADPRMAVDSIRTQLEKQIRRSKSKRFELFEKGSRIIKRIMKRQHD